MNGTAMIFRTITLRRFQELIVYFFAASILGHFLEFIWIAIRQYPVSLSFVQQTFSLVPLPLAEPYGLGVVVIILVVIPFVAKYRLHPGIVFVLNSALMAAVEYICAAALTFALGRDYFWDYSAMPFNIQGYICLETTLLFGILATLFMYVAYPWAERQLKRLSDNAVRNTVLVLVMVYILHFARLAALSI